MIFAACKNYDFDGRVDTVYSLETPSVTAKAYPGVNVVSWKPVTGAKSYNVTVYEEGFQRDSVDTATTDYSFTDTNLKNGKTYTYYVEAVSLSNPGINAREVYATNSRGEASVKAIVPPVGTKSLEFPAYEDGYDGSTVKTVSENDAWVLKPSNIKVAQDNYGNIFVSFPMKAYLSYTVKYYNNELPHEIAATIAKSSISDINANNVTGQVSFNISNAGKYQIAVEASANNYETSEEVICADFVNVEKLDLDRDNSGKETKNCSVNYILDNYVLSGGGIGIHWDELDEDIFVPGLLLGKPSVKFTA